MHSNLIPNPFAWLLLARRQIRWRWVSVALFAFLLIAMAGQWAARREAGFQADNIRRQIEVHALALRGAAAKYSYLPFTVARHPDVLAALADPHDPAVQRRANHYIEEVNRRAGSDALSLIALDGTTLVASNWNTGQSFVGQSYANRAYFSDARAGRSGQFYGVGQTTGEQGLFLSAPVYQTGAVIGVIAVKVSLRQIAEAWVLCATLFCWPIRAASCF